MPGRERRVELEALAHERPSARHGTGSARLFEVERCDAPRLADRRLASRQRHRLEVRDALERSEVAAQQLAAPERPVGAKARAVEDERERRPLLAVLGEASGGVRVMVLDADELQHPALRPLRREVLRVEVVRDESGLDAEHREVQREVGTEGAVGGLRVEVAEMRREERLAPRVTQNVLFSSAPTATIERAGAAR